MIGVMQEKSSRVVEVLLATVRPIQLLGGKVLGIGLVALGQALLLVGVALGLGAAVGSNVLHGAAPLGLLAECWKVEHRCSRCHQAVEPDQLITHARQHEMEVAADS